MSNISAYELWFKQILYEVDSVRELFMNTVGDHLQAFISLSTKLGASSSNCTCRRYEPLHDKTNKMACAPSEDSDQVGHPPSLIRVFAVHMKKTWALSYPLCAQRKI